MSNGDLAMGLSSVMTNTEEMYCMRSSAKKNEVNGMVLQEFDYNLTTNDYNLATEFYISMSMG